MWQRHHPDSSNVTGTGQLLQSPYSFGNLAFGIETFPKYFPPMRFQSSFCWRQKTGTNPPSTGASVTSQKFQQLTSKRFFHKYSFSRLCGLVFWSHASFSQNSRHNSKNTHSNTHIGQNPSEHTDTWYLFYTQKILPSVHPNPKKGHCFYQKEEFHVYSYGGGGQKTTLQWIILLKLYF